MSDKNRVLIDGDMLVYRIASALEEPIHWGDDWWSLYADARQGVALIDEELKKFEDIAKSYDPLATDIKVALTCPVFNWRNNVLPSYKANRKNVRRPVIWNPLRQHLCENHKAVTYRNLEADDIIGILCQKTSIIISDDKDFKSVPCKFLHRPSTGAGSRVTEKRAKRWHFLQTLTGDSADGYKGCPGIGEVRAEKLLKDGTWEEVVGAYSKAGLDEEDALRQAQVAHILQSPSEYNKKTGEVALWKPE